MNITRRCPAKVNLFLEVTGKRPNGYHELATLFAKIDLYDTLKLHIANSAQTDVSLSLTGPVGRFLRADDTNLVCRAARGFLEHFGLTAQLKISLDKQIPTGAGLGGGSSDAAGMLLCLCEFFQKDKNELLPLAARLGADVPLFMYEETFLKGEGIGEKLTPISVAGKLPSLVLIYPNTQVSTADIFKRAHLPSQQQVSARQEQLSRLITCLETAQPLQAWNTLLFNRLEEYVLPFHPAVQEAVTDLKSAQAPAVLMSGSGSTVFALSEDTAQAQQIAACVQRADRQVFCVSFSTPEK